MVEQKPVKVLEKGNVYFFYRPKIGEFAPQSIEDIQRFYMILNPEGKKLYRLVVLAQKRLPGLDDSNKYWGYVEEIVKKPDEVEEIFQGRVYATKTVGERGQPSGRPAGEGFYEIISHKDHTHLVYSLSLPEKLGEVQSDLGIRPEGNFIISLINPNVTPPPNVGFPRGQRASYPENLQKIFGRRRFTKVTKTQFLNYPGSAMVIIGVDREVSRQLGIEVELRAESEEGAKVFKDLRLEKSSHRTEPLFRGRWA